MEDSASKRLAIKVDKKSTEISDGVRWTYFAAIFSGVLQVAMLAITARLVDPASFGILTSGLLVLKACQVLVQSGYERAIVWSENITDKIVAGLFWVSIFTGGMICLLVIFLSGAISDFFGETRLQFTLAALAPMALLSAPGLVARGILRREMRFRELALNEIASYFIGFILVGLPLAMWGMGLWALVLANLGQSLLQGILPLVATRHAVLKSFSASDILAPLRFGYSVSGLGIIEFVDSQAAAIFIGRSYGMESLGVFNRSYALIQLPVEQFGTSLTRVLFSPFNRARGNPERLREAAETPLRLLAALIFPMALGGGAAASTVVDALLGSAWDDAAPIFAALCVGTAAAVLGNLLATMNEALSLIREKTIAQIGVTCVLIFALFAFGRSSIVGAAICFSFTRVLFLMAQILIAAPYLQISRLRLASSLLPGFAIGVAAALAIWAFEGISAIALLHPWLRLALLISVAALVSAAAAAVLIKEARSMVKLVMMRFF